MSSQSLLLLVVIHFLAPPGFAAAQVAEIQKAPEDAQRLREAAQRAEFNRLGRVEFVELRPAKIAAAIVAPEQLLFNRQNLRLSVSLSDGKVQMRVSVSRVSKNDTDFLQTALDEVSQAVETLARKQISELEDLSDPLTQAQQAKLLVAARVDAHHAGRAIRQWFGGRAASPSNPELLLVDVGMLETHFEEINAAIDKHVHGADSLFHKVAQTLLSEEQRRELTNRHLTWFMEKAGLAIRDDQKREQLFQLLVRNAERAAITFGVEAHCCQVARSLSEAELAEFLDEKQLRGLFEIVNYYEQKARK